MLCHSHDLRRRLHGLQERAAKLQREIYASLNTLQIIQIARHPNRPTAKDYINYIFDEFIELHGDRKFSDDKALIGGIGLIDNQPFTFLGHQKGKTTKENLVVPQSEEEVVSLMHLLAIFLFERRHLALVLVVALQCIPLSSIWTSRQGRCIDKSKPTTALAQVAHSVQRAYNGGTDRQHRAVNLFTDIATFAIPIRPVLRLKMRTSRKLQVLAAFLLGGMYVSRALCKIQKD